MEYKIRHISEAFYSQEEECEFPFLWEDRDLNSDWVYFIIANKGEDVGLSLKHALYVKIGVSKNPNKRLGNIRGTTLHPLNYTIWYCVRGGYELEKKLHEFLAEFRARGEWFLVCPEVLEVIRDVPFDIEADMKWAW